MKFSVLIFLGFVLFIAAASYAQTEFKAACQDGYCVMREADLQRIQQIINALVNRIEELQGKSGCT